MSWVKVNGSVLSWVKVDGDGWRWVHGLVIPIFETHFVYL